MKLFSSSRGATLIEALVTIGIMGVVAYFVVELLKTGTMGQKTLQAQDDARVLTDNMASLLADPLACENTFGGASNFSPKPAAFDPTAGAQATYVFDGNSRVQFQTTPGSNVYGNRSLALVSIKVGGPATSQDPKTGIHLWTVTSLPTAPSPTGAAFVQVTWRQTGAANATSTAAGVNNASSNIGGPANLVRYFMLNVNSMSGTTITGCSAQSANGAGFWSLSGSSGAIYNNNNGGTGFVGIGTTNPAVALDVTGVIQASQAVRPGTGFLTGSTCAPEGALGYDISNHWPVYCGAGQQWASYGKGSTSAAGLNSATATSTATATGTSPGPLSCTVVTGSGSATCTTGTLTGGGCQVGSMENYFPVLTSSIPNGNTMSCNGITCNSGRGCYPAASTAYAICCQ